MARWCGSQPLVHRRRFRLGGLRLASWCSPMILICHVATLEYSGVTLPGCCKTWTAATEPLSASFRARADFLEPEHYRTASFFGWDLRVCVWVMARASKLLLPLRQQLRRQSGPDPLVIFARSTNLKDTLLRKARWLESRIWRGFPAIVGYRIGAKSNKS